MGNRNLLFFYDVQHRTVIDKIEMPINVDYKNSKMKMNSAQIIDGYDMEAMQLEAETEDGNRKITLPGSKVSHKKNKEKEILEYSNMKLSPDGQNMCVVSN